jgi:predicted metalloprotease with PDZ domain
MNHYTIKTTAPHRHYLDITMRVETLGHPFVYLQLPAWRPGRYELANYAKNIQYWQVSGNTGQSLPFIKISKDCWKVTTLGSKSIEIRYNYFAFQLDAGGSFFDETQVYVNPVNCLFYLPNRLQEPCIITIEVPSNYQIASALKFDSNRTAKAFTYHELADSPIIASAHFQQNEYTIEDVKFKTTFQGNCKPDWDRLIRDFKTFSLAHIRLFGSMPVREYHFLFQISSFEAYHGVEHSKSCVIHFGPGERLMDEEIYKNFLGICSHELFHCWNIKAIRPVEFMQYDYSKEVYTYLGYMAEGVTSYYGDLQLLRCGIYNWIDYSTRLSNIITSYFHTDGRNYQSLAAASYDTWLHGYSNEISDRKVSMYIKGILFTMLKDVAIRRTSLTGRSMDWIMQTLFRDFGLEKKGYTIEDVEKLFSQNTSENYKSFFKQYFWGTAAIDQLLKESLNWLGCDLIKLSSSKANERFFGLKIIHRNEKCTIDQIAIGSPAELAFLNSQDEILAINHQIINNNVDTLFSNYVEKNIILTIRRDYDLKDTVLKQNGLEYFPTYKIQKLIGATASQNTQFKRWAGQA